NRPSAIGVPSAMGTDCKSPIGLKVDLPAVRAQSQRLRLQPLPQQQRQLRQHLLPQPPQRQPILMIFPSNGFPSATQVIRIRHIH
ncbi:MAG: hypothetical protein AAFQ63_05905, partial [Cyanobacteria bacterium J06621_11]